MAGLTCAHHQHLPLYGALRGSRALPVHDRGLRAHRHRAHRGRPALRTDVLTGWSVGAIYGYVVPSLLHYGFTGGHPLGELKGPGMVAVPVPSVFNAARAWAWREFFDS